MGRIQTKESEVIQAIVTQRIPLVQQILGDLIDAKKIQILMNSNRQQNPNLLHYDFSVDITSLITDSLDAIQAEVVEDSE